VEAEAEGVEAEAVDEITASTSLLVTWKGFPGSPQNHRGF